MPSLVGSEMCIRDRIDDNVQLDAHVTHADGSSEVYRIADMEDVVSDHMPLSVAWDDDSVLLMGYGDVRVRIDLKR